METAINTYEAFKAYNEATSIVELHKSNPQLIEFVLSINEMRAKLG